MVTSARFSTGIFESGVLRDPLIRSEIGLVDLCLAEFRVQRLACLALLNFLADLDDLADLALLAFLSDLVGLAYLLSRHLEQFCRDNEILVGLVYHTVQVCHEIQFSPGAPSKPQEKKTIAWADC